MKKVLITWGPESDNGPFQYLGIVDSLERYSSGSFDLDGCGYFWLSKREVFSLTFAIIY